MVSRANPTFMMISTNLSCSICVLLVLLVNGGSARDTNQISEIFNWFSSLYNNNNQFETGCTIAVTGGLPEPQPLLIVPDTNVFLEPQAKDGIIHLQHNEQVEIYCSGSFVSPFTENRLLLATCSSNNQFMVDDKLFEFSELSCTGQVYHTARRTSGSCGLPDRDETLIEVGFEVNNERFLPIMEICFDEYLEATLYSHYLQTPANAGFQRSFPRPSFITGIFFNGKNVDRLYTQVQQQETMRNILGADRVAELWDISNDIYFARGHLAAKADYIFGSQQRGTFYFVNVAPQWQKFNGGNWENVESGVRDFVATRNLNIEIYTGLWGVLELKDVNGVYQPLYLDFDENNNGLIPVPALYYKLLIDLDTNRGIVIIGLNNPHATEEDIAKHTICRDFSGMIDWLKWDRTNVLRGYSYACEVNEFLRTVNHLPSNIRTSGLLY